MTKRFFLASLAAVLFGLVGASAQTYPSHPITIIVPFAAGGPSDAVARILGARMSSSLGQNVLIENITGAGGSIGVERAERAAPDGYTLSFGHLGTHVFNGAIYRLRYDLLADFAPVALLPSNPMMIVSKNSLPASDLSTLIAWLRANPEKVLVGTAGAGSGSHIAAVYLQQAIGTNFQFISYRGTGPALNDLVGGHIDLIVDQTSNSIAQVRGGNIRAYAVMDNKRVTSAPDIPTVDQAGLPGLYMTLWSGLWAPKGTPKELIARLNGAVTEAMSDPVVRTRLEALGLEAPPTDRQSPEALRAQQKAEIEKWWPILKASNIQAQ